MTAPEWAVELVAETCRAYKVRRPPMSWTRRRASYSSGSTWDDRMHVTAGRDEQDQKLVVLHELAHWIVNRRSFSDAARAKRFHHSARFWRYAMDLYAAHGLTEYAASREGDWKAGARRELERRAA